MQLPCNLAPAQEKQPCWTKLSGCARNHRGRGTRAFTTDFMTSRHLYDVINSRCARFAPGAAPFPASSKYERFLLRIPYTYTTNTSHFHGSFYVTVLYHHFLALVALSFENPRTILNIFIYLRGL